MLKSDCVTNEGDYRVQFGETIERTGKMYSCTFWRTQIGEEIFWTVQGVDVQTPTRMWIVTHYYGIPKNGRKYVHEVTLKHPMQKDIKISYTANCHEGENRIEIGKYLVNQFRNKGGNTFNFDFRIVEAKSKSEL